VSNDLVINTPGVYDISPAAYHRDPVPGGSLSSSGARLLLSATPAEFRYRQFNPKTTDAMDFGSVAHRVVLGKGDDYEVLDFPNRTTNAYKAADKAAREAGRIPILKKDFETVLAMAKVMRENRDVARLMATGKAEQVIIWKAGAIWRRAMLDWINDEGPVDYKTTTDLSDRALAKAVWNYRYDLQLAWYRDACAAVGLPAEKCRLVFQSKTAPYLVRVITIDPYDLAAAQDTNEGLAKVYRDCVALDEWPGYAEGETTISLPTWTRSTDNEETV